MRFAVSMKTFSASESGFISLGLIRLIVPIALLWGGGQGLYTALTNREPHSVTFADYARTHPDNKWVELKDTRLDLLGAISSGMLGSVSELSLLLFIAAFPAAWLCWFRGSGKASSAPAIPPVAPPPLPN